MDDFTWGVIIRPCPATPLEWVNLSEWLVDQLMFQDENDVYTWLQQEDSKRPLHHKLSPLVSLILKTFTKTKDGRPWLLSQASLAQSDPDHLEYTYVGQMVHSIVHEKWKFLCDLYQKDGQLGEVLLERCKPCVVDWRIRPTPTRSTFKPPKTHLTIPQTVEIEYRQYLHQSRPASVSTLRTLVQHVPGCILNDGKVRLDVIP